MNNEMAPQIKAAEVTQEVAPVLSETKIDVEKHFEVGENVVVKRSDGTVDKEGWSVVTTTSKDNGEKVVMVAKQVGKNEFLQKRIRESELVAMQEIEKAPEVVAEIGEEALENTALPEIEQVAAPVVVAEVVVAAEPSNLEKLKALSDDDKEMLDRYRMYYEDKKLAQKENDEKASTEAGYGMGWALERMSEEAKKLADWYARSTF